MTRRATLCKGFEFHGINHLALVCSDMERTVDFYTNVLGMPLVKTIELPAGMGQHFFFDCGGGDALAFFWFPDAPRGTGNLRPDRAPRPRQPRQRYGLDEPCGFLCPAGANRGIPRSPAGGRRGLHRRGQSRRQRVGYHDDLHSGVFIRSIYFQDPDGILLEFACWTRELTPEDVRHQPARAVDQARTDRRCHVCARCPRPKQRPPSCRSCTSISSRDAARWPSLEPPRDLEVIGGQCLPWCQTSSSTRCKGSAFTRVPIVTSTRRFASWPRPGQAGPREPIRLLPALQVASRTRGDEAIIEAIPHWAAADCYARPSAWSWPTPTVWYSIGEGSPDGIFDALHAHLRDEEILELTYIAALYLQHAVMSRALRTEFDDRPEPVVEVVVRGGDASRDVGSDISLPTA